MNGKTTNHSYYLWTKSQLTTWNGAKHPVNPVIFTISTGERRIFEPSTVSWTGCHQLEASTKCSTSNLHGEVADMTKIIENMEEPNILMIFINQKTRGMDGRPCSPHVSCKQIPIHIQHPEQMLCAGFLYSTCIVGDICIGTKYIHHKTPYSTLVVWVVMGI